MNSSSEPVASLLEETRSTQLVSVTVPTYNNQSTVEQCVESLVLQEYPAVEVLVVDDGSNDETLTLIRELEKRFANVRVIVSEHRGPSHARNLGLKQSRGDFVLFADADATYARDYLRKGVRLMLDDIGIGAVCVTGTIWIKKSTFVSRGIALEYEIKQRYLKNGKWKPYFAFLYRQSALQLVGGFDEDLFQSEDKDLFERVKGAGFRVGLVDGFNWVHLYPQDVRSLILRGYRGGKQRVAYLVKKQRYLELLKRTLGLWVLTLLVPFAFVSALALLLLSTGVVAVYLYKLRQITSIANGKGSMRDRLLLPAVSAIRYLSTAVGYTKGSFTYATRRLRGLPTTWSDL